jgi:2-dehydro-3-deoxyphosphogluconate aldolase/(4S)-4-hydroxy-2-oxoglutarate aldolase
MRLLVLTGMTGAPSTMSPKRLYDISIFSILQYSVFMLHLCPGRTGNHAFLLRTVEVNHYMTQTMRSVIDDLCLEASAVGTMAKEEIRSRIEEIGVVPAVRVTSAEDALFVAEALAQAGIPILEIAMNVAGAIDVLSHVVKHAPNTIVGGGSITNVATAQQCLGAGARFLTGDGLVLPVVEFSAKENVVVFPGAFTPTEIITAWNAGSDFVKVIPCDAAGGDSFVRSLKTALPDIPLIAAGGVTQLTAFNLVSAGATALGVGRDLIPAETVRLRQARRIQELARRFLSFVDGGRIQAAGQSYSFA